MGGGAYLRGGGLNRGFTVFYYYWGKVNRSLYQGLRYIDVHYIEVLLLYINMQSRKGK